MEGPQLGVHDLDELDAQLFRDNDSPQPSSSGWGEQGSGAQARAHGQPASSSGAFLESALQPGGKSRGGSSSGPGRELDDLFQGSPGQTLRGWTTSTSGTNATTTYNALLDCKARKRGALMASGVVWARNQVGVSLFVCVCVHVCAFQCQIQIHLACQLACACDCSALLPIFLIGI